MENARHYAKQVHTFDKHHATEYLLSTGKYSWERGQSAVNNTYKLLIQLVSEGQLEKVGTLKNAFFRLPTCKSEFDEHARLLTDELTKFLCSYDCAIFREHSIKEVGLRPDALILLRKEDMGRLFILEVMHKEPISYFNMKVNTWHNWPGACRYLSDLFGYRIPHFEIINKFEEVDNG